MKITEIGLMAARIKARRMELKFTQERFAEMIDITANSYTRIENAFMKPSLDTLIKISVNLNISLDYLVFGNKEDKTNDIEKDMIISLLNRIDTEKLIHAKDMLENIITIKNDMNK